MRLTCFCMVLSTMSFLRRRRRRLRDFSCIPWLPPALGRFTRPDPVTRKRLAAALFVFIFGMTPPSVPPGRADTSYEAEATVLKACRNGARNMMGNGRIVKPAGGQGPRVLAGALRGSSGRGRKLYRSPACGLDVSSPHPLGG